MPCGERVEHTQSQFAKPAALKIEPFLKRHLRNFKAVEKITAVKRGGGLQIGDIIGLRQTFEIKRVHRHVAAQQSNRFAAALKRHLLSLAQSLFERRQSLAQAAPCLRFAALAPQ